MNNNKPWWHPIAHFAAHVTVGTVIFGIIAVPAVLLGYIHHWLVGNPNVPPFTLLVLEYLERAIVIIDAGLFVIYLCLTAMTAVKERFR